MTTDSGGATAGKVVVWSGSKKVQNAAATAALKTIAGVATQTTTNGQRVRIATRGRAFVNSVGTINAGDLLVTDGTTAGSVKSDNAAAAGSIVGRACEAGGGTFANKVLADLCMA